jgi:hypothetical protein
LIAYGGRASRLTSTLTWDAGVSRSTFLRDSAYNYSEFYAGLAQGRSSARLFYSPAYYGAGRTLYLDLSSAYPLGAGVNLAVHAGLLHPFGEYRGGWRLRPTSATSASRRAYRPSAIPTCRVHLRVR